MQIILVRTRNKGMYNIEKYVEGVLDKASLSLFEKKMKKDKKFRKKVILYQNIDEIMRGAVMATAAELDMIEKKIDIIALGFVKDFVRNNEKSRNIRDFLSWS
jgi:hypothetical protein